jgi:ribonuclease HII
LLQFERQLWARGVTRLAGVDEAGRGPLAGPVVAAAVVFEPAYAESAWVGELEGLTDSKKLTLAKRELFFGLLQAEPRAAGGVGIASVAEIDSMNILRATHLAMSRAIAGVGGKVEHILVDGLAVDGLPCESTPIVKGDGRSLSIAAASIIAKVTRDHMLEELDREYPAYGFAKHKGYGTQAHVLALLEHGPTPVHRTSFRPVREAAEIRRRKIAVNLSRRKPRKTARGKQQELF